ncbi:protein Wiz-like isoform X1 [Lates japonicus]|uniref:Protein Wiz-like isoform X1 n=1 Tax=Lates japonicus TaxID=270547 RepID=A0AAD3R8F5_LATJO|nr:protein Wiz-like isoform X1 [Lates japonicus]
MDSQAASQPVMCEVCGTYFETRRGLSSHARLHLRQLGVTVSESSGAPIELLYQLVQERDGSLPNIKADSSTPELTPLKKTAQQESRTPSAAEDNSSSYKAGARVTTTPQKMDHQGSPVRLKDAAATLLPSSPSALRLSEGSSSSSLENQTPTKPLWAPLETDAPITLDTPDEVHVCQLCGCWYETRKGLSSHARAHLRQIGIADKECTCILCGEEFENRKGLSSHARSHLRQIGVTDLMGKSSAIDTIEESWAPKAKKGFRLAVDPLHRKPKPEPVEVEVSVQPKAYSTISNSPTQKSPTAAVASKPFSAVSSTDIQSPPTVLCDFCGQLFETRKALSCHVRAHLRQLGLTWSIKTSPIDLLKEVMLHGEEGRKGSPALGKAVWTPQGSRRSLDGPQSRETASSNSTAPLDYSMKEKSPPGKSGASHADTSCELCGFDFENRKALASHARAHLRQLGIIEWKADGATSPIELLSELIRRDPVKVAAITRRYRTGDLYIKKSQRSAPSPSLSTDSDSVPGSSYKSEHRVGREDSGSSRQSHGHIRTIAAHSDPGVRSPRGVHPPKHTVPRGEENQDTNSQQPPRSGSIPALLPKPPLTPLVKLVGKVYSLKCRFCEEVFHGPLSVQEQWITHLQKHILSLGYKGKASPPAAPVAAPALVHPVAV